MQRRGSLGAGVLRGLAVIVFPGSETLRLSSEEVTTMLDKLKATAPTSLRREPRSRDGKIEKKKKRKIRER